MAPVLNVVVHCSSEGFKRSERVRRKLFSGFNLSPIARQTPNLDQSVCVNKDASLPIFSARLRMNQSIWFTLQRALDFEHLALRGGGAPGSDSRAARIYGAGRHNAVHSVVGGPWYRRCEGGELARRLRRQYKRAQRYDVFLVGQVTSICAQKLRI
jgi:hypothetical protein